MCRFTVDFHSDSFSIIGSVHYYNLIYHLETVFSSMNSYLAFIGFGTASLLQTCIIALVDLLSMNSFLSYFLMKATVEYPFQYHFRGHDSVVTCS